VHYGSLFSGLKGLLDDFVGPNIDSACELVEAAGRFLIRLPETKSRMENMLEQMMRLKKVGWGG
jgi:regulator of nonsense transcripts 2